MKTELFIARRIMSGDKDKNKLSRPIVIISLTSIILGVAIMLITVSVITGFQQGIRNKVIGFGSHIQIIKGGLNGSMESNPILIAQDFYPSLEDNEAVRKIQPFGYKPAILQAYRDSVSLTVGKRDTSKSSLDIMGVLFKGINKDYDWQFFDDKLVTGRVINFDSKNNEVMLSEQIAQLMGYKIGDNCDAFFIRDNSGPKKKKFEIVGIYNSGFEQFDKKLIFTQLHHIQKLNNWGVQTFITLADTCLDNRFALKAITSGGTKNYRYNWGDGYVRSQYLPLPENNSEITLISTDFEQTALSSRLTEVSIPDTASITITLDSICNCNTETLTLINYESASSINAPFGELSITNGKGSQQLYAGGFEVILNNWEDLEKMDLIISEEIPYDLNSTKITQMHLDIFAWLDLLDMNILIIIILILVVSLINMITSLLVLILEKTNMIGILKAMGGKTGSIRKIFIFNALFLLSRGLLWGNVLGLGLLAIQYFTGIFTLNAAVYSLDTVPVDFDLLNIIYINALTILVCFIILIVPSYLVTKINPIKAIRFD